MTIIYSLTMRPASLAFLVALCFFGANVARAQDTPEANITFLEFFKARIAKSDIKNGLDAAHAAKSVSDVCPFDTDAAALRVLLEYGAVYSAVDTVKPPPRCVFSNEAEVRAFHSSLKTKWAVFGDVNIELQEAAMDALLEARSEALAIGIDITPIDGPIAAKRTFYDTSRIWGSRFEPALKYWVSMGRISDSEATAVRSMNVLKLLATVFEWESKGCYFSTNLSTSILTSVAPPGASQHISMLAIDVAEHNSVELRSILAKYGWYQTVRNDLPHFTFLGKPQRELPGSGLRYELSRDRQFWVPAVNAARSGGSGTGLIEPGRATIGSNGLPGEETLEFKVGETAVKAFVHRGPVPGPTLFNMHDDENTSVEAAKTFLKENGGTLVELTHTGRRLITFSLEGKSYSFDPNRIFTPAGVAATLATNGGTSRAAEAEVARFARELIDKFVSKSDLIVALHNNTNGEYSVASYLRGGEFARDAARTRVDPRNDRDDFFYVTDERLFDMISARGFNAVLQNNATVRDDGSLSVYCASKQIRYINVEAEHGNQAEQLKMLRALHEVLEVSNR